MARGIRYAIMIFNFDPVKIFWYGYHANRDEATTPVPGKFVKKKRKEEQTIAHVLRLSDFFLYRLEYSPSFYQFNHTCTAIS